jgi:hypothetical protein
LEAQQKALNNDMANTIHQWAEQALQAEAFSMEKRRGGQDMKKLFLCSFALRVSTYMNDGHKDQDFSRIVWASDEKDAKRVISEQPEFKTDEYSVYRTIMDFDASEAIGEHS